MTRFLRFLFLAALILFSTSFLKGEDSIYFDIRGFVSAGGGYDSHIPTMGRDSSDRKGSGEILTDAGINFDINDFSIGTAVFVNALNTDNWRYSLLNTEINLGWITSTGDFDWSIFSVGSFSFYDFSGLSTHYAQGDLYLEMFYNHHENMSFFFTLTSSYIHGLKEELSFLRGPQIGFETGEYFYFNFRSYLRLQYQLNFMFYGDHTTENVPTVVSDGITELTGKNKGISQFLSLRTRLDFDRFYIFLGAGWRNMTMFHRDNWETMEKIVKKRRVNNSIVLDVEPGFIPFKKSFDQLSIYAHYIFEKNFSTLGREDYVDENYIRHNIRVMLSYYF